MKVTDCWYKKTLVRVAISRPFCIAVPFFAGGGGPKYLISLFWNKKALFKGIHTLNGDQFKYRKIEREGNSL